MGTILSPLRLMDRLSGYDPEDRSSTLLEEAMRPSGEIGKHDGLKHRCFWLVGSSPTLGTTSFRAEN